MTKNVSVTKYAMTAHGQPNANVSDAKTRQSWENWVNACSNNGDTKPAGTSTSSYVYKKITIPAIKGISKATTTSVKGKPWTFATNEFDFNIPSCAYISKITFVLHIKTSGKITVKVPQGRFNLYNGSKSVSNTYKDGSGWKDGIFYYQPNKNLTNSWQSVEYVMTGDEFRRRGYPISELNGSLMGIDFRWNNASKITGVHGVYIQYVGCIIDYEMPDQSVVFSDVTTEDNPLFKPSGAEFNVSMQYRNRSNAGCCGGTVKKIKIDVPPNVKLRAVNGNFNVQTMEWTVNCIPNASENLILGIIDYGLGEKPITVSNSDIAPNTLWYYSTPVKNDVGEVAPYPDTYMQEGLMSCVTFKSVVTATDGLATFNVDMAFRHDYSDVHWSIVESETDSGISIESSDDGVIVFNVPANKRVELTFRGCFIPRFNGNTRVEVSLDTGDPVKAEYTVLPAPTFHIRNESKTKVTDRDVAEIVLNPSRLNFITHRIATNTELGAYVIECGVAPFDSKTIEKRCTLTADIWEAVDYIGVVPLEYHHYDPDSTYSNKAISNSYKNKTYKGKEGVIEEKIGLKFKVRPWESPTLQGMAEMDKPTPINANHKCFEGDPLNHRGWVVLSEVKLKKTNPLWYDVEAEVDYLTHDIHTKFQIFKDVKPINSVGMPDLTAEEFGLNDSFASRLDLFSVDTDGGYIYDEEGEEGTNNIFSLDEGQTLNIKTVRALSDYSKIRFDWYSNRIRETRENNLERVFRLVDESGQSVFEYEYSNFKFYEDYITCTVILRVKTEDGWKTYSYDDVDLRMEVEADPIIDVGADVVEPDEEDSGSIDTGEETSSTANATEDVYYRYDSELETYVEITDGDYDGDKYVYNESSGNYDLVVDDGDDEPAYVEGDIAPTFDLNEYNVTQVYGTSLIFEINGSKLNITDEGYNGREFVSNDIELQSKSYYFETEWKNKNNDGMTEDIISFIGISLEETILETDYSQYYKDTVVSPFPIPYKKVMFTRKSEEGTIYYLTGEEPFKYLLEPYYQYHCGCDLLGDRTSIFDLNNSYTHYYIENGLVRLGFNKYNGRLYVAKYDPTSDEWVTTHYFHMVNEPKFAVAGSISDDKIVIRAGTDTYFTIWRGRPFIGITNPNDVIYIDSNFSYCLSDKVNGDTYDYPIIFSFRNTDNKLPIGIGGKTLNYDEFTIEDDTIIRTIDHEITLSKQELEGIQTYQEVTIHPTITPTPTTGKVHLFVNGADISQSESPFQLTHTFNEAGTYKVYAVYVGSDESDNIAFSPIYDVIVEAPAPVVEHHEEVTGEYNLSIISAPSKFVYRDNQKIVMQLKKGSTGIKGEVVEIVLPNGSTKSAYTGVDGKFEIVNNNTSYVPGTHQWGARYYDPQDLDHNNKLICTALKSIKIEKATPTFTHNDADGKVGKGKTLTIKLNGVDSKINASKAGLAGKKVTYKINDGSKGSFKTNSNGKYSIKFNTRGTRKLTLYFAGSIRYAAIQKTFVIKVV